MGKIEGKRVSRLYIIIIYYMYTQNIRTHVIPKQIYMTLRHYF